MGFRVPFRVTCCMWMNGWMDGGWDALLRCFLSPPPPSFSLAGFARVHGFERCHDALGCITHRYTCTTCLLAIRFGLDRVRPPGPVLSVLPVCFLCRRVTSVQSILLRGYRSHSIKKKDEQEDPEVLVVFRPPLLLSFMETQQPLKMHHALIVQMGWWSLSGCCPRDKQRWCGVRVICVNRLNHPTGGEPPPSALDSSIFSKVSDR